jgi:hypothetical protein
MVFMANSTVLVGMAGIMALLGGACGGGTSAGAGPGDDGRLAQSGQTGSVACAENVSAACSALAGHVIVELEMLEADPGSQQGTFEIILPMNPSPSFNDGDIGRTVKGPYGFFPLAAAKNKPGDWSLDGSSRLVPGDRVVATFWESEYRNAHCPGYSECMGPCYSQNTDYVVIEACSDECAEACVPERSEVPWSTTLWVLPVAESYDFAGEVVTHSELAALSDRSHCLALFPMPEVPPCHDSGPTE